MQRCQQETAKEKEKNKKLPKLPVHDNDDSKKGNKNQKSRQSQEEDKREWKRSKDILANVCKVLNINPKLVDCIPVYGFSKNDVNGTRPQKANAKRIVRKLMEEICDLVSPFNEEFISSFKFDDRTTQMMIKVPRRDGDVDVDEEAGDYNTANELVDSNNDDNNDKADGDDKPPATTTTTATTPSPRYKYVSIRKVSNTKLYANLANVIFFGTKQNRAVAESVLMSSCSREECRAILWDRYVNHHRINNKSSTSSNNNKLNETNGATGDKHDNDDDDDTNNKRKKAKRNENITPVPPKERRESDDDDDDDDDYIPQKKQQQETDNNDDDENDTSQQTLRRSKRKHNEINYSEGRGGGMRGVVAVDDDTDDDDDADYYDDNNNNNTNTKLEEAARRKQKEGGRESMIQMKKWATVSTERFSAARKLYSDCIIEGMDVPADYPVSSADRRRRLKSALSFLQCHLIVNNDDEKGRRRGRSTVSGSGRRAAGRDIEIRGQVFRNICLYEKPRYPLRFPSKEVYDDRRGKNNKALMKKSKSKNPLQVLYFIYQHNTNQKKNAVAGNLKRRKVEEISSLTTGTGAATSSKRKSNTSNNYNNKQNDDSNNHNQQQQQQQPNLCLEYEIFCDLVKALTTTSSSTSTK